MLLVVAAVVVVVMVVAEEGTLPAVDVAAACAAGEAVTVEVEEEAVVAKGEGPGNARPTDPKTLYPGVPAKVGPTDIDNGGGWV